MTKAADRIRNERRINALPGGTHDKLIRFLAKALPAALGAVVAVMIIAPLFPHGEVSFLLDRNKVETTEDRVKVEQAMYRGQDENGRPFSLTAGSATQHLTSRAAVEMRDLAARMMLKDGPAELRAPDGSYNYDSNTVEVRGPVDFRAADGYKLTTSNVTIDLKQQHITGANGVAGAVPAGTFSADRIEADLDDRTVALIGRAQLTMQPGRLAPPKK